MSLVGHSLGSLIVFDLLSNQKQQNQFENQSSGDDETIKDVDKFLTDFGLSSYIELFKKEKIDTKSLVNSF